MRAADSILARTDSYKPSHWKMDPPDTTGGFGYFEARTGGMYPNTMLFGLQAILLEELVGRRVDHEAVDEMETMMGVHLGPGVFNADGWHRLVDRHDGRVPVEIKAVPEGTMHPLGTVLITVESTDPEFSWVTQYIEPLLSHVWHASTVATRSAYIRPIITGALEATGCDPAAADFMLHDFGYRGATCTQAATRAGMGHLVSFKGTDTIVSLFGAVDLYGADPSTVGFSIPAAEHSVMTAMGEDGELAQAERILDAYPSGLVAMPIDSYNPRRFVSDYLCDKLADKIAHRDGKVIARPDSPQDWATPGEQMEWIAEQLAATFGHTTTTTGHRLLDSHVGVIWGDGINPDGVQAALQHLANKGFAAASFAFGMGGHLHQVLNRDTQRCAFKRSAIKVNGNWRDVQKRTPGKESKGGRFGDLNLPVVFRDGELVNPITFAEVRSNAAGSAWKVRL